MRPQRSPAIYLLGAYVLLLAYASLYPFEGWRWPAIPSLQELLLLRWPPWRNRFDEWSNFLGYVPFGALMFGALVHHQSRSAAGLWLVTLLVGAALSYALEFTQHVVPGRFPSLRDWVNNSLGCALGALLAWWMHALGWLTASERWRARWFVPHSSAALVLLVLWPVGLLFPTPVPLGLGQLDGDAWRRAADAFGPLLSQLGWASDAPASASVIRSDLKRPDAAPLSTLREAWVMATGLAAPCLLAGVVTRIGWRRWCLAPGVTVIALAVMTLSTALNFGPDHAFAWMTRLHVQALVATTLVCASLCVLGPRWCVALALLALTAMVWLLADAPADPYYSASLQGWEQGRFIRFHGLAQWIGFLWPYATAAWLLAWWLRKR